LNCPYDEHYEEILDAAIFAVLDLGFLIRSAMEWDDASIARLARIISLMENCRLSIHDLSRGTTDEKTNLPRFNMPFELGIFVGLAHANRDRGKEMRCMILDVDADRYRISLSDMSGVDIYQRSTSPNSIIGPIRSFLRKNTLRPSQRIPGARYVALRYEKFTADFPNILYALRIEPSELVFQDKVNIMTEWLLSERSNIE